jgi:hypothetical protein
MIKGSDTLAWGSLFNEWKLTPAGPTASPWAGSRSPRSGGLSIRRSGTGGARQAGGFSRFAGWHVFYFFVYQIVATG